VTQTGVSPGLVLVVVGLLGLLVGSFLNVVIHRVPDGRSVLRPRSACPACGTPIEPRDNIPVVSWLLLRGRCRSCSAPISRRYPLVEVTTGLLWIVLTAWALPSPTARSMLPVLLIVGAVGIALTFIDLDHHRLPNVLVLPLYPVAICGVLVAGWLSGEWPWVAAAAGAGIWLVVVGLPWLVSGGRGMGFGDVKLAPVLGLLLGWWALSSAIVGLLAAFLVGAIVGVGLMVAGRAGRRSALPFGPFLLGGALIGLLFGRWLGSSYANLFLGG
jgi:leader peptidase (prepilin peptidase)/N-methyltransferase